jgi:hypothetical protein
MWGPFWAPALILINVEAEIDAEEHPLACRGYGLEALTPAAAEILKIDRFQVREVDHLVDGNERDGEDPSGGRMIVFQEAGDDIDEPVLEGTETGGTRRVPAGMTAATGIKLAYEHLGPGIPLGVALQELDIAALQRAIFSGRPRA